MIHLGQLLVIHLVVEHDDELNHEGFEVLKIFFEVFDDLHDDEADELIWKICFDEWDEELDEVVKEREPKLKKSL